MKLYERCSDHYGDMLDHEPLAKDVCSLASYKMIICSKLPR